MRSSRRGRRRGPVPSAPLSVLDRLRLSHFYPFLTPLSQRLELWTWPLRGRPEPVPHLLKQRTVLAYAIRFGCDVLFETGTWLGTMACAMAPHLERIETIELDPFLAARARWRLRDLSNVRVYEGDSAELLPELLRAPPRAPIFWLDAHHSGAITARGPQDPPLMAEVDAILERCDGPVVLIDDAHALTGVAGYPPLAELEERIHRHDPSWVFEVRHDLVRIHPRSV